MARLALLVQHWRWLLPLVALPLIWWQWPRPIDEARLRPPAGLPAGLESLRFGLPRPMDEMVRRARGMSSGVLAGAIRLSSSEAIREGARPIPPDIKDWLAPHYGRDVLATIRWTTRGRRIELGSLLTAWVLEEGAVTLDRVVVFDSEQLTGNLWLWAHELAHVEQYRRLGVEGFAEAYLADWEAMEAEATARGNAVVAAIRAEEENAPVRWLARGD